MNGNGMGSSDKKAVLTGIVEGMPPVAPSKTEHDEAASIVKEEPTAREVFFAWEKLRIIYNVLLTLLVLGC